MDYKDSAWLGTSFELERRDHYGEWEAKLTHSQFDLDWSLSYVDTDLSKSECAYYNGFDDVCSATVVVGVSKTF